MTPARHGFTLIELVAALVLASIMMVAMLRIVNLVSRETNQLRGEQRDYVAAGVLADRLREDFINSRGVRIGPNQIALAGFPQGSPGLIAYEKRTVGDQSVLVRVSSARTELLWVGLGNLVFEALEDADGEDVTAAEGSGGLPPMPGRFRMAMTDASGHVLFQEVVVHHAN